MLHRKLWVWALLFPILSTNAQSYVPVIVNGEVFFKTELETAQGLVLSEVTVANFEKINGQLYNRVFFNRNLEGDVFIGHLREDPEAGQIYYRPISANTDLLVYDISMEVGDAITLSARWCDGLPGDVATVVAVNEVDGRRQVVFNRMVGNADICETLSFLEGVGPNASVIFPYFRNAIPQNGVALRICHASRSAVIFYPAGTGADFCGIEITHDETLAPPVEVAVFPNPFVGRLYVSADTPVETVACFSMNGQLLGLHQGTDFIDTDHLPPGMYLLRIQLQDGTASVHKVVKQP